MLKTFSTLFLIMIFFISCQTGKEDLKNFSDDYKQITQKLKEKRKDVKERDEFTAFNEEKKKEYENLLKKYAESPDIDGIEILRSKILVILWDLERPKDKKAERDMKKLEDAEKKIDEIIADKPDLINEAKMVKVNILIKKKKYNEAYDIFKDIEPEITDADDLFNAYFYTALLHTDNKIKKEYSEKFLNTDNIPEDQVKNRYMMYFNLASIATIEGDRDKAGEILKEGIAATEDERQKTSLEKNLSQLDLIGKEAIPLNANHWINSSPLRLTDLQGKVVLVYFWAPWCPPCRVLLPTIVEEYNKHKDEGFMVIGITKLTGKYSDEEVDLGKVSKEEELELIKKYMERKKVKFPVVVAEVDDRSDLNNYKITGIPTQIFINKQGICDFIKSGSGNVPFIIDRIKSLLAE